MTDALKIVLVGETIAGSRTPQRRDAFRALGHHVVMVSVNVDGASYEDKPRFIDRLRYRFRVPADPAGANAAMIRAVRDDGCDLLWVENARMIRAEALAAVKAAAPGAKLVWYSEDDTMNPRHRTVWMENAIPLYDLWVTTKSFNANPDEVPSLGAKRVFFVHNSFDPTFHRPMDLTEDERRTWGADVAFVGTFEEPRAQSMLYLAEHGLTVRVWGNGWSGWNDRHPNLKVESRPVYGEDLIRVINATKINLCFLRKFNRDLQTCRSMEIPACGGFMAHERNAEITQVFAENEEAVYFSDNDELTALCRRWLDDEGGRQRIAQAGRNKAASGGHTHGDRLNQVLAALKEDE